MLGRARQGAVAAGLVRLLDLEKGKVMESAGYTKEEGWFVFPVGVLRRKPTLRGEIVFKATCVWAKSPKSQMHTLYKTEKAAWAEAKRQFVAEEKLLLKQLDQLAEMRSMNPPPEWERNAKKRLSIVLAGLALCDQ